MAPKKFLSEEMVFNSDSDYEQKPSLKGKARETSKYTKKRTATSATLEEPLPKHLKTFHPHPAKVRGKQIVPFEVNDEVEPIIVRRKPKMDSKNQVSDGDDQQTPPKKIVERIITRVMPESPTNTGDSSTSEEADLEPVKGEFKKFDLEPPKETSKEADVLKPIKNVKDMSNRRDRMYPPDIECVYRLAPGQDWISHVIKGLRETTKPNLQDFPTKGSIQSPGLLEWQGDMKKWRNYIRTTWNLRDYGLSLSFVWAKIANLRGQAVIEPPALPIFAKHKQSARPYEELIARMSHAKAARATFVLKFEVGEETMEETKE